MARTGRQIVIRGPLDLDLQDVERDPKVGENEILVENRYTAISAGTELSIYTGTNPRVYEPNSWCNYPHVPGYAGLGEVVGIGDGIQDLAIGDQIFHHAHHSQFEKLNTRFSPYVKISREQMLPEMALVRFGAIVLSGSVRLARIELGDKIALIGLGIIGQFAAQLFGLSGADVFAFDPVERRRRLAESIGSCTGVYDPRSTNPTDTISGLTQGRGVDILIDATGQSALIVANIGLVRQMGQVILLGSPFDSYDSDITPFLRQIHLKWLTVRGALERDRLVPPSEYVPHPYLSDVIYLLRLIERGKLKVRPLLSHIMSPSEFRKAYEGLLTKKEEYSAVIIDWKIP